jgi:hypothetical protein
MNAFSSSARLAVPLASVPHLAIPVAMMAKPALVNAELAAESWFKNLGAVSALIDHFDYSG